MAGDQIAADDSRVFLGLNGARIEALSRDGKKIWSSEFGGEISSNIIATDGSLFFATSEVAGETSKSSGSKLRWVSKDTGITNWTMTLPDTDRHYLGLFNGAVIVVSKNGALDAIDVRSGKVEWTRQIAEGFVGEPSFTASSVMLATTGKQILDVSLKNGEINSVRKFPFAVTALSAAENYVLILGDERGNVSASNGGDKPIWTFKTGGEISKVSAFDGHVLVASHDNFVYFLSSRNGGRIWKKRLSGRIGQISRVTERFALISSFEEREAVLTDIANGRVAGRIVFGENESLVARPIAANGLIFVLTNTAAYSYSLNGCPQNK
ncbi:MAG: PQQ-binding-like beta-propeller repeat protein [Chloracidobacterium sp.]|nr:PQQ-binding-like beta-propeller repeat protein [Chloracidobacterium sp.]